jgi:hypothetical protein
MHAVSICLLLLCLLIAICDVESFHFNKCSFSRYFVRKAGDAPTEDAVEKTGDVIVDNTMKKVDAGLTHIKYNKYAPSAEEAATMTDEEFRGTMMRRMVSMQMFMFLFMHEFICT